MDLYFWNETVDPEKKKHKGYGLHHRLVLLMTNVLYNYVHIKYYFPYVKLFIYFDLDYFVQWKVVLRDDKPKTNSKRKRTLSRVDTKTTMTETGQGW